MQNVPALLHASMMYGLSAPIAMQRETASVHVMANAGAMPVVTDRAIARNKRKLPSSTLATEEPYYLDLASNGLPTVPLQTKADLQLGRNDPFWQSMIGRPQTLVLERIIRFDIAQLLANRRPTFAKAAAHFRNRTLRQAEYDRSVGVGISLVGPLKCRQSKSAVGS
jgi:hypothetical protein